MTIKRRLLSLVLLVAMALGLPSVIALTITITSPAWAADYQGNQARKPAALVAPEPDTKISIYSNPEAGQGQTGFGKSGDAVTVLEQIGSNQGTLWNRVRFDNPHYVEGWVQDQFVSLQSAEKQANQLQQSEQQGDRYLGNQSPTQQNRSQTYSQQNQQ
ncbi:MAG: hypothetical protein WA902_21695 [Thermosynechococcaceae cyanobacterium]